MKAASGLSRSTIYDRIKKGTFPAAVSLGGSAVGWPESEIGAWIRRAIASGQKRGGADNNTGVQWRKPLR